MGASRAVSWWAELRESSCRLRWSLFCAKMQNTGPDRLTPLNDFGPMHQSRSMARNSTFEPFGPKRCGSTKLFEWQLPLHLNCPHLSSVVSTCGVPPPPQPSSTQPPAYQWPAPNRQIQTFQRLCSEIRRLMHFGGPLAAKTPPNIALDPPKV